MKRVLVGGLVGVVFGLGLATAGMTDPAKVLGFLDLAGEWDPSLLLVLGAAVVVASTGYAIVLRYPAPLLDARFDLPKPRSIDAPLLLGAALFGIGWGVAGYCPGPAIASLANGNRELRFFLPAMIVGMLARYLHARRKVRPAVLRTDDNV